MGVERQPESSTDLVPNHNRARKGKIVLNGFKPDPNQPSSEPIEQADISGVTQALDALEKRQIRPKRGRF